MLDLCRTRFNRKMKSAKIKIKIKIKTWSSAL